MESSVALREGARVWVLAMDKTNQLKTAATSPPNNNDALTKRLSEKWLSSVPRPQRMVNQVLQQLRNGRVRIVEVENTRSRRRPTSL
jgi:hypothetical protein